MATYLEILQANNDDIRVRVLPGSITTIMDAALRDTVANELKNRGVLQAADTTALALVSTDNTNLVVVKNVGLFQKLASGAAPNGVTTFDTPEAGFLWEKILSISAVATEPERFTVTGNHTYSLQDGFSIDKIKVKPTNAPTVKIGLIPAGDEVLMATVLTANVMNTVTYDIDAEGAAVNVYFTGITASTDIIIYKRSLT